MRAGFPGKPLLLYALLGIFVSSGAAPALSANPGLGELRDFLAARPAIDNPHAFLEALPPSLRSHYNLAYASRTAEAERVLVGRRNPRIVLNVLDGTAALPYGGEREQFSDRVILAITPGSPTVELIEFAGGEFRPAKFVFRRSSPRDSFRHGDRPVNLQASVQSCFHCHSGARRGTTDERELAASFRPNWDTYPLWAGFYGSIEHGVSSPALRTLRSNSAYLERESAWLSDFLVDIRADETNIYRNLVGWETMSLTTLAEMNFKTGLALTGMNGVRVAGHMEAHSAFQTMSELIFAVEHTRELSFAGLAARAGRDPRSMMREFEEEVGRERQRVDRQETERRRRAAEVLDLASGGFSYEDFEGVDSRLNTYLALIWKTFAPELSERVQSWPLSFVSRPSNEGAALAFQHGFLGPWHRALLHGIRLRGGCRATVATPAR